MPDAFINYLARLGWSHGDQEFFTRKELIEKFSLENIGKSAGIFDPEKLLALNADHIMALDPAQLVDPLAPFLLKHGFGIENRSFVEKVIQTLQPRSKTLADMAGAALFYFQDDIEYEDKAARKFLKPSALEPLQQLQAEMESIDAFTEKNLEQAFKNVMSATGLKLGKIAQPVRVALTGRTASPGIFEVTEIVGKEKVMSRLEKAIEYVESKKL